MRQNGTTRRRFLKAAGAAISAPLLIPASAIGAGGQVAPSERIVMATIGCGGRGRGDMRGFMGNSDVQMVAVCDPVPAHRQEALRNVNDRYGNKDCREYNDFREVLVRDDIDAVLIGTPDHWHAIITIEACQHGMDVFCEKPECLTIREGRAMVDAVRRHGRVFSGGSQRVLGDYGNWPRIVRSGALGQIQEVFVSCGGPSGDCYLDPQPIPPGLDWDMWLGPAPWRPYHESLTKGGFRPYRDYSGGGMTDWGAHRFGAALFATGRHNTGPVEIYPPDEDHERLTFVFADGMKMYHGGTNNITYVGSEGQLPGVHRTPVQRVDMEGYHGSGGLFGDFIHCVRTREEPFRNVEAAHRATTVCHLGNIAYWLKRPLKWDPDREEIVDDPVAARWLDRPRRGPWTI
jgi:predicted dehydrogenase